MTTTKTNSAFYSLILISLGIICGLYYLRMVVPVQHQFIVDMHRAFVQLEQGEPLRFRVLSPALLNLFAPVGDTGRILLAYILAYMLGFPALFLSAFAWFRCTLDDQRALTASCLVAIYTFWMMQTWVYELYTLLEAIFLCIGLYLLAREPKTLTVRYAALVFMATLNRETAILLIFAYAAWFYPRRRERAYWFHIVGFSALWAVIFVGLRLIIGPAPQEITVSEIAALNLGGGWFTMDALLNNLPFAPIWAGALLRVRAATPALQRLALVALPYAGLFILFGVWREIRLLLPLLLLLLPLVFVQSRTEQALSSLRAGDVKPV